MATGTNRGPSRRLVVAEPGAVFSEADTLLYRAQDAQEEQAVEVDSSPLESRFDAALANQIQAKYDQAERIEDRLEHLTERQASSLQQAQSRQPGLLTLPGTRAKWEDGIQRQRASLLRLQSRLELVREIKDGMSPSGTRVEDLAVRKLRMQERELVESWEELREAQRLHALHQRRIEQEKKHALEEQQRATHGRSRVLGLTQPRY